MLQDLAASIQLLDALRLRQAQLSVRHAVLHRYPPPPFDLHATLLAPHLPASHALVCICKTLRGRISSAWQMRPCFWARYVAVMRMGVLHFRGLSHRPPDWLHWLKLTHIRTQKSRSALYKQKAADPSCCRSCHNAQGRVRVLQKCMSC